MHFSNSHRVAGTFDAVSYTRVPAWHGRKKTHSWATTRWFSFVMGRTGNGTTIPRSKSLQKVLATSGTSIWLACGLTGEWRSRKQVDTIAALPQISDLMRPHAFQIPPTPAQVQSTTKMERRAILKNDRTTKCTTAEWTTNPNTARMS